MENLPIPKPQRRESVGKDAKKAEYYLAAMEGRRQGLSFVKIGMKLGVSDKTAAKYVRYCLTELAKLTKAETEEYRALELERLDSLLASVINQAESGNLWAVDRAVSIIALRCRILGIEKPASLVVAGDRNNPLTVEHHQHDIGQRLLERMTRLAEGRPEPGDLAPKSPPSDEIIDITPSAIPGD